MERSPERLYAELGYGNIQGKQTLHNLFDKLLKNCKTSLDIF